MSLISDLIPVVDQARKTIEQTGFRINDVRLVTYTWLVDKGIGTPTKVEVIVDPRPKVLKYEAQKEVLSGGVVIDADFQVSKISKTYTLVDLMGPDNLPENQEFFWSIDGILYSPVSYQERPIGWNIWVKRTHRKL